MKNTYWIPFLCLTGLFLFLFSDSMAYVISYHEQQELFLFSRPYLEKYIYEIGGAGRYISNFITQFFYFPLAGKLIFSLLLSSLYLLPYLTCRKLTGKEDPLHIALLMPLHLLIQFESVDFNFYHASNLFCSFLILYLLSFSGKKYFCYTLIPFLLITGFCLGYSSPLLSVSILFVTGLSARYLTPYLTNKKRYFYCSAICLCLYTGSTFYSFVIHYNMKERLLLEAETYVINKEWDKVLICSGKLRGNNQLMEYFRNMALFHTGRMPYDLLKYPQSKGVASLYLPWTGEARRSRYGHYIYEQLGYINEAHRWAFEAMVVYGETAPIVINLIRYNIANRRYPIALRFINILKQTLFYQKEAEKYEKMIREKQNPLPNALPYAPNEKIRFANILNLGPELSYLCDRDSTNRMAFEYLMSNLILSNQITRFAENLERIRNFAYPSLPRLYEEALYSYKLGVDDETFQVLGFTISQETEERFRNYYILYQHKELKKLKEQFGDTFWYYLHFLSPYGNKIIDK